MSILSLNKISKSYIQGATNLHILKQLDLEVNRGEIVAITGQSGAGKSSLLAIIAGIDRPDSGQIIIGDTNLNSLSENELTKFRGKKIGIVFQQFHLIPHLTALENVMLPLEIAGDRHAVTQARQSLASVGLAERANHFPSQLSGGECQRVAIARAFTTEPEFLLADEPSGSLDSATGNQVMDLLFSEVKRRAMTLVIVTHSEDLALKCNRQFRLKEGKLTESTGLSGRHEGHP